MAVTELDEACEILKQAQDLTAEIKILEDLKVASMKDEVLRQSYSRMIKETRAKRHLLTESIRYVELKTFAAVIKTYLTPPQYDEAWRKVDELISNPKLMQDWRASFKERN